jgi:hypothetical protein
MPIYLLIILVIKIASVLLPIHLGKLAYQEISIAYDHRANEVRQLRFVDKDQNPFPEVSVELPTKWKPNAKQTIRYLIESSPKEPVTITLISATKDLNNIDNTITFEPEGDISESVDVTYKPSSNRLGITSCQIVAKIEVDNQSSLYYSQPKYVSLISSKTLRRSVFQSILYVIIFIGALLLVGIFIIFIW